MNEMIKAIVRKGTLQPVKFDVLTGTFTDGCDITTFSTGWTMGYRTGVTSLEALYWQHMCHAYGLEYALEHSNDKVPNQWLHYDVIRIEGIKTGMTGMESIKGIPIVTDYDRVELIPIKRIMIKDNL